MSEHNTNRVLLYIEASSVDALVKLQVLNNTINMKSYNYQFPQRVGKKERVWFYDDVTNYIRVTEKDLKENLPERIKR
jgi:hypothetical protein